MWDIRVIDVRAVDGTRRPRGQHVREVDVREVDVREVDVREVDAADGAVFPEVRGGTGAVAGLTRCAAGARAADVMDAIVRMRCRVVVFASIVSEGKGKYRCKLSLFTYRILGINRMFVLWLEMNIIISKYLRIYRDKNSRFREWADYLLK